MNKKSQITIFIILGLVLLLSIGTYIYYTTTKETARIEEKRPVIQKTPVEFAPVTQLVNSCLYATARTALKRIGESGGYIDTTKISYAPFEPTEGEGLELAPQSRLIIPYWHYLKDRNDCIGDCAFDTKRLPIEREAGKLSIEGQTDDYINENIEFCLNNFETLKKQGYNIKAEKPKAKTTITKEDVFVTLKYPLTIKKANATHRQDTFYTELQINFREIYDLATKITNLEAEYQYMEKNIRELIDAFSRNSKDSIPPVSDLKFGFGTGNIWIKMQIERKLKELLTNYMQLLQVSGTRNLRHITPPTTAMVKDKELFDVLYNRGMLIPLDENLSEMHPTLSVRHNYLDWWKPYLNIGGCRGQICQPESFSNTFMLIFGIQRYNFNYDVSLPVLIEIKNPTALKGDGYTFNFALEANMRDNKPMPKKYEPLTQISGVSTISMFCDEEQKTGGELKLKLVEPRTNKKVNDAAVSYTCGKQHCALGTTQNGTLAVGMPKCLGGIIGAEKQEYYPTYLPFDTHTGEAQELTMMIEPYKKVNFAVKKYLLKKGQGWQLDMENLIDQAHDEQTMIALERKITPYEQPFTPFAEIFGGPLSKEKDLSQDIRIVPGNYTVRLNTIKYPKPEIIIPRDKRCIKSGILEEEDCMFVPNESMIFDQKNPLPVGGAEYELEITPENLDGVKTIEWKVLNFALDKVIEDDRKIEDLEQIGKLQEYSQQAQEQLKPSFAK